MKSIAVPAVVTLAISLSTLAHAEPRKGFYLGGGLGLHSTEFSATDGVNTASENNTGFETAIKIGGYLNPQFALYYLREASWWDDEDIDETIVTGLTGIGGTYYMEPNAGGGYVEFGVGLGDLATFSNDSFDPQYGTAVLLGAGLEANEHVQLGVLYKRATMEDSMYPEIEYTTSSMAARIEFKL